MFCRGLLLSTLLLAVIFVSTLDAKKCNNFQLGKSAKKGQVKSEGGECSACTGYICKIGGKNILGTACTEDVKEICQQNWDDSKLESIAKEKKYQSEKGKYFVFSCQEDECNTVQWVTDSSSIQYAKEIAASDLSFDSTHGQRFKRRSNVKFTSGEEIIYDSDKCPTMTVEERKKVRKVLNAKGRADILVCPDDLIKGADGAVTPDQCEIMTEEERKEAQKAADKSGLGITVCPDNGVEKIGYGIGLIVVTLGYFFFINL